VQPVDFPSFAPKPVNLSRYDDPEFDFAAESAEIPPGLVAKIYHPPGSLVSRALCGRSTLGFPKGAVNQVVHELKKYLSECVSQNLIAESNYVDCVVENIRLEWRAAEARTPTSIIAELEPKIKECAERLRKVQEQFVCFLILSWEKQKFVVDVDRQLALDDLMLKFEGEAMELDEEWNSERMQARYNKPSPKLMGLRKHCHDLLVARRFQEANELALSIQDCEVAEGMEAGERMNHDYKQAHERLEERFKAEQSTANEVFESKMNAVLIKQGKELRPIETRLANFEKARAIAELNARQLAREKGGEQEKQVPVVRQNPQTRFAGKLRLPPLRPIKSSFQ
jgi:hypothetical protein